MLLSTGLSVGIGVNVCKKNSIPVKKKKSYTSFCLDHGRWKNNQQIVSAKKQQIIAGHVFYGIERELDLSQPPVYMTTLRDPLSRAASAILYSYALHNKTLISEFDAVQVLRHAFNETIHSGELSTQVEDIFKRLSGGMKQHLKVSSSAFLPPAKDVSAQKKRKLHDAVLYVAELF